VNLSAWWTQRARREKQLLMGACLVVTAAGVWWVAIAPALQTLDQFERVRTSQAASLQRMRMLQTQAQALQANPAVTSAVAAQALQAATEKAFGTQADLTILNGTATVNLRNVSPDALAQWLASARTSARAVPAQARITQTKSGWTGSMQLTLPGN
jgi:general secretion pathway protein M